jgi:short-subunit dehydrogenase
MLWGAVHPALAVLPGMRARGDGAIAVVTSIGGKVAVPHLLPYATAKFAAVGFSEGLAAEVAADGVRVTTVVPGLMRTGSHLNALFAGRHRAEFTWFGLAASLPVLSVDVRRAATQVLDAVERGRVEIIIGWPAKLAARVHGLMPATTTRVLAAVDRLLPSPGGAGQGRRPGHESETPVTRSPATLLGARAAERQRQLDHAKRSTHHTRGSEG